MAIDTVVVLTDGRRIDLSGFSPKAAVARLQALHITASDIDYTEHRIAARRVQYWADESVADLQQFFTATGLGVHDPGSWHAYILWKAARS